MAVASNEPPGPLFEHESLNLEQQNFRLLRLLPTSHVDAIECELTVEASPSIPQDPTQAESPDDERKVSYNALSYEWGSEDAPQHWIRINKGHFKILHNLWEFLRMAVAKLHVLSEVEFAEPLWIDAICINQKALSERAHQVKQMGDIYRCARAVFVWLGPSCSQQLNVVSQELKRLGQEAENPPLQMTPYDIFLQSRYLRDQVIGPSSAVRQAFLEICDRPYWTRMWIAQEIICARTAYLILDNHIFSWTLIKRIMAYTNFSESWYEACQSVPTLQTIKALTLGEKHNTISDAVAQYQDSQCSDPRDKVYATLGMVPDGGLFPIDYSIDLEYLFYQISAASYECTYSVEEHVGATDSAKQLVLLGSASSHERRADTTSLSSINDARQSLGISFSALEGFLAANAMIARAVQMKFSKTDTFKMKREPDVVDHCFYIDCWSSALFQSCSVVMRVSQSTGYYRGPKTCRVLFVPRSYLNGPPLYLQSEISFVGSWSESSKWVSFPLTVATFLVRTVHACEEIMDMDDVDRKELLPGGEGSLHGLDLIMGRDPYRLHHEGEFAWNTEDY